MPKAIKSALTSPTTTPLRRAHRLLASSFGFWLGSWLGSCQIDELKRPHGRMVLAQLVQSRGLSPRVRRAVSSIR